MLVFLLNQQAMNLCFLIVLSFFYGMLTYNKPDDNAFKMYQTAFLPLTLIAFTWMKSYMIYSSNLTMLCQSKSATGDASIRWRILLNGHYDVVPCVPDAWNCPGAPLTEY